MSNENSSQPLDGNAGAAYVPTNPQELFELLQRQSQQMMAQAQLVEQLRQVVMENTQQ